MGMIYIGIVYQVYRYDTFLSAPDKENLAKMFFFNWDKFTKYAPDHWFLLIIDLTYIVKVLIQLRFNPWLGGPFAIFLMLLRELFIFTLFFFLF